MAQSDTIMINAPLTPGEDQDPEPNPAIDYSPASAPYDEAFENQLMNILLYPPQNNSPPRSSNSNPMINPTTLPIPLTSSVRTHPSPIPGLLLTHKNGYHTGGPGPSPAIAAEFARKFIEEHGIEDAGQLERIVEEKIKAKLEKARDIMKEREAAVRKNRELERQIEDLDVQREAELRVVEKIKGGKKK